VAAYTTPADLAALLGVTFTPEQEIQAQGLCDAVTAFIDNTTGRTWQASASPVTAELANVLPTSAGWHDYYGVAYLNNRPVTSITALSLRTAYPNVEISSLDTAEYELLDPANGAVSLVVSPWYGDPLLLAVVDYVFGAVPPADIVYVAKAIASGVMARLLAVQAVSGQMSTRPDLAGVESISVGQNDVSVRMAAGATDGGLASYATSDTSSWVTPGSVVADILAYHKGARGVLA
jgi:hypothetical protein